MLQHQEIAEIEPDLEAIRRRLQSKDTELRVAAEQDLNGLAARDLINLMATENEHRRRRTRRLIVGICAYMALALACVFFAHSGQFFLICGSFTGIVASAMAFSTAHKGA